MTTETHRSTPSLAASGAGNPLPNYPGAKSGSGVTQWLINHTPPHDCYIEAFLGSGALLRLKRPALSSIAIDIDDQVISAWPQNHLPELTIIAGDALLLLPTLEEFHHETTLLYCDPPYMLSTRRSQLKLYRSEFHTKKQHMELLDLLLTAKCKVIISGYHSKYYQHRLQNWRSAEFKTTTHHGLPCTEVIWMNFEDSGELHDYRFVGEGFRERERIRKKINRWARMLNAMPPHERNAIIERVSQLRPSSPSPASVATVHHAHQRR